MIHTIIYNVVTTNAPRAWNKLPSSIRATSPTDYFAKKLKCFYFLVFFNYAHLYTYVCVMFGALAVCTFTYGAINID